MKNNPIFFNYKVQNNGQRLDVFIDGTIVDAETQEIWKNWFDDETSVSFKSFRTEIMDSGLKNVRITINSFGGQIGDAMAMHDFIQSLENEGYAIETIGMGMICSAATYVLSAAKNSKISPNSYYMIHNVSGGIYGDVDEVEKYAKTLRNFNNNIRDYYVNLTGKDANQIQEWMKAETWFTGKQAVENGFVAATTDQKEEFTPVNASQFNFKNKSALNAFNSFVGKNKPLNLENLNQDDMNKLIEGIVNAFKANNLIGDKGQNTEPLTAENLTSALNTAFKDYDLEPKAPTDEQVTNAVSNFFKDGLPENVITQIANAIKDSNKPVNFSETEDFKKINEDIASLQNAVIKNLGQAKPRNKADEDNDPYDHDDIGFTNSK